YLLYAALGSQGIESEVISIVPPDRGRIFVGNWRFIEGRRFIDTGPNGVAESVAEGDDVVILPPGTGVPHSRIWIAPQLSAPPLHGDDEGLYRVGPNGLADTRVDSALALTIIPRGFGLESQRAYQLEPDTDPASIRLGGDDVIAQHINTLYVLTGPNGILETERQPGFRQGRATGPPATIAPGAGGSTPAPTASRRRPAPTRGREDPTPSRSRPGPTASSTRVPAATTASSTSPSSSTSRPTASSTSTAATCGRSPVR